MFIICIISYIPEHHRVQISPGVTTGELLKFFVEKNICIKSNVISQNFTYGGLLATGSHVRPVLYNITVEIIRKSVDSLRILI